MHCTKCTLEEEKNNLQVRRNIKNEIKNVEVWTASQGSTFASLRHDWTKICNFTLILKVKKYGGSSVQKVFGIGITLNKKPSFHGEKAENYNKKHY